PPALAAARTLPGALVQDRLELLVLAAQDAAAYPMLAAIAEARSQGEPGRTIALRLASEPTESTLAALRALAGGSVTSPQIALGEPDAPAASDDEATAAETEMAEEAAAPLHDRPALINAFVAPRNDVENELAAIWRKALGIERI